VKPSTFTETHSLEHEHNPNHDYFACTKRIIAQSANSVQGLDGQGSFPSRLIPLLADHLKGTYKVLYSADAGVFPRKSNDRSINLTTHKYGAKIIDVRISAVIKEIEQNQLTWYGHVQRMAEGRLPKIALKWMRNKREHEEDPRKTGWKV
jgi:hypothetical protein